ncbi:MAG: D-glycerate dehydrogenase [Melioribacteraceae bacterium]|nr:D-glycerate dehydrogenase [Melioribacteraceae bacterium]
MIANCAVGYNNIDVHYAKRKNIIVTNTPNVLTDATADIAVGLIIACARRFYEAEKLIREKNFNGWNPHLLLGLDLKNKTLGIIGAGKIGFATAERMKSFGMKIIYYDRNKKDNFENELNAKKVSLEKLIKNSDVISIHLPLTEKTKYLIDKSKLDLLKPNAILINTARGEIVEEKYLIELLRKKKIFAAGFDVYENEPNINPKLLKLKNVFLLPHIGSATKETRAAMSLLAAKNIINVLKGKKPLTPVF